MDEKLLALMSENDRMCEALRNISEHQAEIKKILDSVSDLLKNDEPDESAPFTEEDVIQLLKKYSRIH